MTIDATLPDLHRAAVLISARDLHDLGDPPVLLDVRWALGDPHGREHYLAGHLPGAVYVDLDTELAALAVAGVPAALYPGSWSAWSADPARPVATQPKGDPR